MGVGMGSGQWVGTLKMTHLLLSAEGKQQWPEFCMQPSSSVFVDVHNRLK